MSNLLTYIQSQTKPRYTDLQQTSLSQYIKTQTANTPQQTTTQSSIPQKYGTVNGTTKLPSHIENQGLYNLSNEKNGITAVTEGFGLGVSNTLKNIANTIDTVKAYTAVPAGVYKDIQSAFYDVNKAGLVAGIVDSNQQKYGKNSTYRSNIESDIVQRNNTQNQWTQQVYDKHKDIKYGDKIIGIGQGVASTLPYMAVSAATMSPAAGRMALGWNTLGDAVGEALSDGATFDQATGYALSQAGKEMAISKLAGGIPYLDDGLFSTGGITEKYISNPLLQALINRGVDIVGEGAEEAASTYLTPYLKRAFYDKTAPNATPQQLWNSFKSGANISAILGIASGMGKIASYTADVDKPNNIYKVYAEAVDRENQQYLTQLEKTTDVQQFEQYVDVLQELAPATIEDFINIKYNDTDSYAQLERTYNIVSQYENNIGKMPAAKIVELHSKGVQSKANFTGKARTRGNIGVMLLDGKKYIANSQIDINTERGYYNYKGDKAEIVLCPAEQQFTPLVEDGYLRDIDSEYKLFEYAATIAKDGKHHTLEMLSEKSMCNSCKSVMNEFKTRYPNVDITVVSYASEKAKNNYNNNQSFKDDVRRIYTDANRR